jgi:hypothetical protein
MDLSGTGALTGCVYLWSDLKRPKQPQYANYEVE